MLENNNKSLYFFANGHYELSKFSQAFQKKLSCISPERPFIFLCIGSDRATGDSLGPLVGQILSKALQSTKKAIVYGTLHQTVHAGNLVQTLADIYNRFDNPYIIAIDASLGVPKHIGYVTLGDGSLHPGIGVNHPLPETGDIHITGIVNHSTHNNHFTLQTTKLYTVMQLAVFISDGILSALHVSPSFQRPKKRHFINIF